MEINEKFCVSAYRVTVNFKYWSNYFYGDFKQFKDFAHIFIATGDFGHYFCI